MSDKVTVYLISGKAGNGKDAMFKLAENNVGWKRGAFADELKETVKKLYGLSDEQVYGNLKDVQDERYPNFVDPQRIWKLKFGLIPWKVKNPEYLPYLTPRRILQVFGQQQRALCPTLWADYLFRETIPGLVKEGYRQIAVTDTRFPNEIETGEKWLLKTEPGLEKRLVKVRVVRPNKFSKSCKSDESEVALDKYGDWDHIVVNDSSLSQLKKKVLNIIRLEGRVS
jgi:hypothetical protein